MLMDALGRPLRNLRLSVTDRCNLRCQYCMPETDYAWLPRQDLLQFEEIVRLVDLFLAQGVDHIRLTGGEPLLRRDLPALVEMIADRPGLRDLALTSNGILLSDQISALKAAGLRRVTVSLDTLHPERFRALTRSDELTRVRRGIAAAAETFGRLKLDTVVMRGINDDELVDLIEFGAEHQAEVRFIEYMDVGGATHWTPAAVLSKRDMLAQLERHYGAITPLPKTDAAPADQFQLPDGRVFGIIASTTEPFCRTCERSRLTADGVWLLCLYAAQGVDLRGPLRAGMSDQELAALIGTTWAQRRDRGAELRAGLGDRRAFVPLSTLKGNPHLEMHTRGG